MQFAFLGGTLVAHPLPSLAARFGGGALAYGTAAALIGVLATLGLAACFATAHERPRATADAAPARALRRR